MLSFPLGSDCIKHSVSRANMRLRSCVTSINIALFMWEISSHDWEYSPVRPHCFVKLTWKWMRIFAPSASLQLLTVSWCIIVDSVCLHGHRVALRKAYFVHITVFLRHGKAYGKHSYAFPGVSDSACQLLHLCVCEHEYFCFMLMSTFCEATGGCLSCLGFSSEHTLCKTCRTRKNTTDPSVYCIEKWHIPLYSILVSPLTFMRKCDAVGFRLLLGVFNRVFLWEQTNGMGRV